MEEWLDGGEEALAEELVQRIECLLAIHAEFQAYIDGAEA